MKSPFNFKIKHNNGKVYDMHDIGVWVEYFHIYSPNPHRIKRERRKTGEQLIRTREGTRQIETKLQLQTNSILELDELKHEIYSIFYSEKEFEIIRDLNPTKRIKAVQEEAYDIDNITCSDGDFIIPLAMYIPYLLGPIKTININESKQTFKIAGQTEMPWTSKTTFTAPQSQYVLESIKGKITLNYEFISGDVLEIDYETRDIKLNGVILDVGLSLNSVWFDLSVGDMWFVASHVTELSYRERFY